MIRSPIRSPLSSAIRSVFDPSRGGINIAGLFGAYAGREGAYYGAASDPSITALIADNLKALDAGVPITGWVADPTATATINGNSLSGTTGSGSNQLASVSVTGLEVGAAYAVVGRLSSTSQRLAFYLNDPGFSSLGFQLGGLYVGFFRPKASAINLAPVGGGGSSVLSISDVKLHRVDWDRLIAFADPAGTVPLMSQHQDDRGFGLLLDRSKGLQRGPELVNNGAFGSTANWGVDAGWTIAGGVAAFTQPGSGNRNVYGTNVNGNFPVPGRCYEVIYSVVSGSGFRPILGGSVGPTSGGPGRYRCILLATTNAGIVINGALATNGSIDDVSVKEVLGNHYVQPTATARGELTARVNQWAASEDIRTATWTKGGTVPVDAEFLREDTTTGTHQVFQGFSVPAGAEVVFRCELKADGRTKVEFGGNWVFTTIVVDLITGAVSGSGAALVTTTLLADGWVRCVFRGAPPDTTGRSYLIRLLGPGDVDSYPGDGASGVRIRKADWRFSSDAIPSIPSYQRVGAVATDYDSEGFPVRWRGQTDDFGKARINPNGATKALVMWAGQKLSDAAVGIVVESSSDSSATNGTLALFAPNTAGQPRYMLRSRGTATAEAQDSTHSAPGRDVIRAQAGIATDVADLYVDGALAAQSATDQGTGAYTEQDVFFWSRAGTSQFFNGYASTLPMLLFMQPGDPGLTASQIAQLDKVYGKAGGVAL